MNITHDVICAFTKFENPMDFHKAVQDLIQHVVGIEPARLNMQHIRECIGQDERCDEDAQRVSEYVSRELAARSNYIDGV
jgi:hypothetical protein